MAEPLLEEAFSDLGEEPLEPEPPAPEPLELAELPESLEVEPPDPLEEDSDFEPDFSLDFWESEPADLFWSAARLSVR